MMKKLQVMKRRLELMMVKLVVVEVREDGISRVPGTAEVLESVLTIQTTNGPPANPFLEAKQEPQYATASPSSFLRHNR